MREAGNTPIRVLVVDEDAAVRKFLQRELSAAGYEVDTLSSGNGFTEDMVALVRPDVLLVDPFIGDVPLPAVENLLARLRETQQLVLLLIDNGRDPRLVRQISLACKADGQLEKRHLLEAPANAVGEQLLPEADVEDLLPSIPSAQNASDTGEEIILQMDPLPARQPPTSRPARRRAPSRPDFLAMIEEELHQQAPPPPGPKPVQIEINLFSRHNFYVGSSGSLATGGVFVVTAHLLPVGQRVPLQLKVSSAGIVNTEAVVEWRRETAHMERTLLGLGLSLSHLPEKDRRALEQFFRERAPLTYLPHRK